MRTQEGVVIMIIDNKIMLSLFDSVDRARYYHWCADISLAGKDYKVTEVIFFVKNESNPLSDYIQIKMYDDLFCLIAVYTQDSSLIQECMEYLDKIKNNFKEFELRTPFSHVLKHDSILTRFTLEDSQCPASPVYFINSREELLDIKHDEEIIVTVLNDADKAEIASNVTEGRLDAKEMSEQAFCPCTVFNDVKFYIVRVNGNIVGYLRAECGYKNIYDIGWLYIEPCYRGNGYAPALVSCFSKDMFTNGLIPHYGYAISKESARVAEKCGYQCDKTQLICKKLIKRDGVIKVAVEC